MYKFKIKKIQILQQKKSPGEPACTISRFDATILTRSRYANGKRLMVNSY